MKSLRQLAFRYLVRLLFGAALLAANWKSTGVIAFLGGVVAMGIILWNFTLLGSLAALRTRMKYPEYEEKITHWTPGEKMLHYASYGLLLLALPCIALFGKQLENMIGGKTFFFQYTGIGLGLAGLVLWLLKSAYPAYFKNNEQRAGAILALFFGLTFWTLALAVGYNGQGAGSRTYPLKALVLRKSTNARYGNHYVFLRIDGKEERFEPARQAWHALVEGDTTLLTVGRGKLGYPCIIHFTQPGSTRTIRTTNNQ